MVIFSKLPSAAQYDLKNQFSQDNNINNDKKDAKTAYRPYGYAIGNKGQIRNIPRQNFEKNRGQCLGKKLQCPL